jgi:hypothetical protein
LQRVIVGSQTLPVGQARAVSIGDCAFGDCPLLSAVLVRYVGFIGAGCFQGDARLQEFVVLAVSPQFPGFGPNTFEGCFALERFEFPCRPTKIGSGCFWNCHSFNAVSLLYPSYPGLDPVLKISLLPPRCFGGTALSCLSLPLTVEEVGTDCCSNCSQLSGVFFGSGGDCLLRKIASWAFFNCGKLCEISIPASVEVIGVGCFAGAASLRGLCFCASLPDGAGALLSIDSGAFAGCPLGNVDLPDRTHSVGVGCFSSAASVTFRGAPLDYRTAAQLCAFPSSRAGGRPVTLELGGLMLLRGFGSSYFVRDSRSGEVLITQLPHPPPGGDWHIPVVDYICPGCFGFSSAHSFVFSGGCRIREISEAAFLVAELELIEIPPSVEILKARCFYRCARLKQVTFTPDSRLRELEEFSFAESALEAIVLPGCVVVIAADCFSLCKYLRSVSFMEVSQVQALNQGTCAEACPPQSVGDECACCDSVQSGPLVGPSLLQFGYRAFKGIAVTQISVPSSVKEIGAECFYNCLQLLSLTFESNSILRKLCPDAFGRSALRQITVPSSVEVVAAGCFSCSQLESIVFEGGSMLRVLGPHAFSLSLLSQIIIPRNVEVIGDACLVDCRRLSSVVFEDDSRLREIGKRAFSYSGVSQIIIPRDVEAIGDSCFHDCRQLSLVEFEDGSHLREIGSCAFWGTSVRRVSLPSSVKIVGKWIFSTGTCVILPDPLCPFPSNPGFASHLVPRGFVLPDSSVLGNPRRMMAAACSGVCLPVSSAECGTRN